MIYPVKNLSRIVMKFNIVDNKEIECELVNINNLRVGILIRLYDLKNNLELLFDDISRNEILGIFSSKNGDTKLLLEEFCISDCIEVGIDKEKLLDIKVNENLLEKLGYRLEYEVIEYSEFLEEKQKFKEISKEIFYEKIKENIDKLFLAVDGTKEFIKCNTPIIDIDYIKRGV